MAHETRSKYLPPELFALAQFVFFRFGPSLEYRVNDGGQCQLTVVGKPDTTFQRVQW